MAVGPPRGPSYCLSCLSSILSVHIEAIRVGRHWETLRLLKLLQRRGQRGTGNCCSIFQTFFFGARSGRIVLTRLRLLITSVLREMGRGRPCSFRKRPQALHRTDPNSSRRHNGVVEVLQFWQVGCVDPLVAIMTAVDCNGKEMRSGGGQRRLLSRSR